MLKITLNLQSPQNIRKSFPGPTVSKKDQTCKFYYTSVNKKVAFTVIQ